LNEFFDRGYYWHGNETDQQAAYLFTLAGQAGKTQEWVRRIINEEYSTGPGGLSGNEDAGQMSAWLVCSMMGFYPVCPGNPEYVIGSPSFEEIRIQSNPQNKPFIIKALGNSSQSVYVSTMKLNGTLFSGHSIQHAQIVAGGELMMTMVAK
jgi:putative alpha-1,2-mannosidase